jgi:hypothetical protein
MSDDDRQRLASEQARLVEALGGRASPPDHFDAARVELAARTLLQKRARTIAKTWPGLMEGVDALFDEYATAHALPAAGPVADARAFAEYLLRRGTLSDELRVELVTRRAATGWPLRWIRLRDAKRVIVALRVPRLGVRKLSPPWLR